MRIAVVGAQAPELCRLTGRLALPLQTLADAADSTWDILGLARGVSGDLQRAVRTRCLLLPGDSGASLLRSIRAEQIVGYGLSPRHTLTLSSLAGEERILCLQRALVTLDGRLIEPQELSLPPELSALDAEQALLAAGLLLLSARGVSGAKAVNRAL
ncbi:MAG: hypothetical protein IJU66_08955 [Oscillospiraceae bacterium]|nr:hypothetical protein [Oscillospiraceae bacterium]